ncbi:MAG: lamin tail domain-containing protein [Corynebacterium sp.]|uniref:lamin tail domain-containing protein n=1 Tax=Corynebacterium sp. TaxID=1720 RepID=UPI0026DEED58|nr:lamin tail domain-containing protein [Corynebacterium sp.]MDO5670431.1 lamin tail domain-containing protein [Corynebacterium sp.]
MSFRPAALSAAVTLAAVGLAPAASAAPDGDQVIINEVYSNGAGLSGPYLNDFIELYNPSDDTILLDGMTVTVFGGVNGDSYGSVELQGSLAAGDHFLLKLNNSAAYPSEGAVELENFDITADVRVPSQNASVLLAFDESTLDLVGFGVTERYEGTAARAAAYDQSLSRTDGIDTDDNAADFTSQVPSPQHSVIEVADTPEAGELSAELSSR